jgi:hypothetical protein
MCRLSLLSTSQQSHSVRHPSPVEKTLLPARMMLLSLSQQNALLSALKREYSSYRNTSSCSLKGLSSLVHYWSKRTAHPKRAGGLKGTELAAHLFSTEDCNPKICWAFRESVTKPTDYRKSENVLIRKRPKVGRGCLMKSQLLHQGS